MINQKALDQERTRKSELAAEECEKIKPLYEKEVFNRVIRKGTSVAHDYQGRRER